MTFMPTIELTLAIGAYAQKWHLDEPAGNLTETVRQWETVCKSNGVIPLSHPSQRNNIWLKKNQWFAEDVLPILRERVQTALA
ncbi:MAG: uracil-DNA glycosylase [Polaribacter sp.]|jgi:uracil-DNA glycosylase